ncbi:putative sulfate exporter family transporter [Propioniciclava flava]
MKSLLPGLAVCAVAATAALLINLSVPVLSALLIAIVLGMLVGNLLPLPPSCAPGVAYSAKRLLRIEVSSRWDSRSHSLTLQGSAGAWSVW